MPTWWNKSSTKDGKMSSKKECFISGIRRKFKNAVESKGNWKSDGSQTPKNILSGKVFSLSRSALNSRQVSRCPSFVEKSYPQPLPIPGVDHVIVAGSSHKLEPSLRSKPFASSLPQSIPHRANPSHNEGALATDSGSSDSLLSNDDPVDAHPLSSHASENGSENRTAISSPYGTKHKDQSLLYTRKDQLKPLGKSYRDPVPPTSRQRAHFHSLQIPTCVGFSSAPTSMKTSPCRSPVKGQAWDPLINLKPYLDLNSLSPGNCSSPGSGQNSGHNSAGMFSPALSPRMLSPGPSSAVCSPRMSPRMMSPGPSSRVHSGTVTPQNPRGGGVAAELHISRFDDGKYLQSHQLPVPPTRGSGSSPFSASSSAVMNPKSPGGLENPTSPVQKWKKGRLLGRGTFGHVYLGFSSETGEMCAMKEVALFPDDSKSRECTEQLRQEIALLSQLRHPNIVRYYGSEIISDKLYIYLEYVSGGSIHKLLQDYGPLGESAVRSYTQQILSGLQYLHAKNTVHRDIKGANILVEPSGLVKLADFGMAKHINGQSCSLSFKGSPYWMAPEVIKNSDRCNLAVDIWSLGCTVIEMATAKPPWSQYEGIPAMFKIGNSKELPSIPANLSEEGKDFVRQCLQRNPQSRPTAAALLRHPFVKNSTAFERPAAIDITRSMGFGNVRKVLCFPSEEVAKHQCTDSQMAPQSREPHNMPKNISCPVSPTGSPLLNKKAKDLPIRISPSALMAIPHTKSGSSTSYMVSGSGHGGGGALASRFRLQQPMHKGNERKFLNTDEILNPQIFHGKSDVSYVYKQSISLENRSNRNQFTWPVMGPP